MNNDNIIEAYLASKGIFPAKRYRNYLIYHAPYRPDRTPSMKVENDQWFDFGIGEGGGLKQLQQKMGEVTNFFHHEASNTLEIASRSENTVRLNYTKEIGTNEVLNQYLRYRGISIPIAKKYCREVYYSNGNKKFFAIGLPTINPDSFALRNKDFKGNLGSGVSFFSNGCIGKRLLVFEGCFSMLSFWQMFKDFQNLLGGDVLVLNSLANKNKVDDYASSYQQISLYLDNDLAGKKATNELLNKYSDAEDVSPLYENVNDLNDHLKEWSDMISSIKFNRR